jgi:Conjugative transposon protein TcpC
MFRVPNSGNGGRPRNYSSVMPLLSSADPGGAVLGGAVPGGEIDPPAADLSAGRTWSGAGGRWRLWPLRMALWSALLIIAYRGVTAIVFNQASAPQPGAPGGRATEQFPVMLAEAYAAEFGQVYLNVSPAIQAQREQELAAFVPSSVAAADPDFGWNGAGQLQLQSEQVTGIAVQNPRQAVVTLLATVNDQLMELGVPVAASGGGVVISGEPAWLPAPQQISPPVTPSRGSDPVAQGELMNELPAFFQAYASGDSGALDRFAVRGVSLTGLGGTVTFGSIASLQVPPGGATRQITVTVIWQVPGPGESGVTKLAMAYGMSVVDLQSGKWYVNKISAANEAVGAK